MNKKRLLYILLGCFVLILIASIILVVFLITRSDDELEKIKDFVTSSETCTQENTTFTVSPIDIEDLTSIVPLGNLNPSAHVFPTGHMYYGVRRKIPNDSESPTIDATLFAPIDATIENISSMTQTNEDPPSTDYSLSFRTCEDFTFYFIHVTSLSVKLMNEVTFEDIDCDEYSTGGRDYRNCWKEVDIKVKAGETLGTVGSGIRTNFDFGAVDFRITPHTYANPDRWKEKREDMFYKVCSTDYYTGELKQILESKLGDFGGNPRIIKPICGTIAQDEPGTAQGIWILSGINEVNQEDQHMALVHDNFDPSTGVFSIGISLESIGIKSGTYKFDPRKSGTINLDFDLVKPGNQIYCYEVGGSFYNQDNTFSILIQLVSENTLRIGQYNSPSCGKGSWELKDYKEFGR